MDSSDFIYREEIVPKSLQLDGAPDGYWQVYSDDMPPFGFPLPSQWVTKSVSPPSPVWLKFRRLALLMYFRMFCCAWFGFAVDSKTIRYLAIIGLFCSVLFSLSQLLPVLRDLAGGYNFKPPAIRLKSPFPFFLFLFTVLRTRFSRG